MRWQKKTTHRTTEQKKPSCSMLKKKNDWNSAIVSEEFSCVCSQIETAKIKQQIKLFCVFCFEINGIFVIVPQIFGDDNSAYK